MALVDIIAELQALAASQPQFSQADLDKAVSDAKAADQGVIDQLTADKVALEAQVAAMPGQIHQAVLAEDQMLAQQLKPILDKLLQS